MSERLTESERAVFLEEISKSYTHGWNCARAELLPLLDAERQRGDDLEAALAARGAGDGLAGRVAAILDDPNGGPVEVGFGRNSRHMHAEPICAHPSCQTYLAPDRMALERIRALLDPDAQGADE